VKLRRVEAVVNAASGSVGHGAAEALEAIVAGFGLEVRVANAQPSDIPAAVAAAVQAKPDLLIVLAGDGTARLAAELCGPDGPLVAALPGGTMNMLPKALYGTTNWRDALHATLERGEVRCVSGGEVGGKAFYVAAILGAPALWADAREAVRAMDLKGALGKARHAYQRAFAGRLRYVLEERWIRKAEALTLMCPLVSKKLDRDDSLEVDALDPKNVAEGMRIGLRAIFGGVLGDWREDASVTTELCRHGRAWAHGRIPGILDGESYLFERGVEFRFRPDAFKALAPPLEPPPVEPQDVISESVKGAG
jgi:diacylglycerol kinase family enzyme